MSKFKELEFNKNFNTGGTYKDWWKQALIKKPPPQLAKVTKVRPTNKPEKPLPTSNKNKGDDEFTKYLKRLEENKRKNSVPPIEQSTAPVPIIEQPTSPVPIIEQPTPIIEQSTTPAYQGNLDAFIAPTPIIEQSTSPVPIIEQPTSPVPIIEQPTPIIEQSIAPTPIIEQSTSPVPIIEQSIAPTPIIEQSTATTAPIEEFNELVSKMEISDFTLGIENIDEIINNRQLSRYFIDKYFLNNYQKELEKEKYIIIFELRKIVDLLYYGFEFNKFVTEEDIKNNEDIIIQNAKSSKISFLLDRLQELSKNNIENFKNITPENYADIKDISLSDLTDLIDLEKSDSIEVMNRYLKYFGYKIIISKFANGILGPTDIKSEETFERIKVIRNILNMISVSSGTEPNKINKLVSTLIENVNLLKNPNK